MKSFYLHFAVLISIALLIVNCELERAAKKPAGQEPTQVQIKPSVIPLDSVKPPQVIDLSKLPPPQTIKIPTKSGSLRKIPAVFSAFIKNYSIEDGLPTNSVNAGAVDKFGNLWFGTNGGGAFQFNGKSFSGYYTDQGLSGDHVYCVFVDRSGNIWFGSDSGVSKYDGESFTRFTTQQGLAGEIVNSIIEDKKGSLWFATNMGVSRFDGRTFSNFTQAQGLVDNFVRSILIDNSGYLWFGTNGGISLFDGKSFTNFTTEEGLVDDAVYASLKDQSGNLWFGTANGISKYDGKKFFNWTKDDEPALGTRVTSILEDSASHFWFGTDGAGVLEFDGKVFSHLTKAQGLSSDRVRHLLSDGAGKIWVTTNEGISRYDKSFANLTKAQGLKNDFVRALLQDKLQNIWIGTDDGLVKYDGHTLTTYSKEQGLVGNAIRGAFEDRSGNIWFGTERGLSKYDGTSFTNFTAEQGIPQDVEITSIVEDRPGNLWLASYLSPGFLAKFDNKSLTIYTKEQGLAGTRVYTILEDSKGLMWFATTEGVSSFDGKSFTTYTSKQGLPNDDVPSIVEDKNGFFWFASEGLSRYDGHSFQNYFVGEGLSRGRIGNLILTKDGLIAGGHLHGLFIFPGYQRREFDESKINNMCQNNGQVDLQVENKLTNQDLGIYAPVFEIFTAQTGFPTAAPSTGQNQMITDTEGNIWFGTGSEKTGLVRFDYAALSTIGLRAPHVGLLSMQIDAKQVNWHQLLHSASSSTINEEYLTFGKKRSQTESDANIHEFGDVRFDGISKWSPIPQNLVLPYKHNNVTFNFMATELSRPQEVLYQYKLDGYDNDWSRAGNKTSATYGNIHEGTYQFNLRARSPSGVCSVLFTYTFEVLPPWYRSWWAYTLYVIAGLAILYLIFRWRTALLRKRLAVLDLLYGAAERFVPKAFLKLLNKEHIEDVKLGDNIETEITVLFTDIRGYTTLAEKLRPTQAYAFINSYWEIEAPIIEARQGFISQYLGDGVMALFPRQADDAVEAVLDMIEGLSTFNEGQAKANGHQIQVGYGLSTGHAVLGTIGTKTRMDANVISNTSNLASRVESLNKYYGTMFLISDATKNALSDPKKYTTRLVDKIKAKGMKNTIRLYELYKRNSIDEKGQRFITTYETAFSAYESGDLKAAIAGFRECLNLKPLEVSSGILLERCESLSQNGLPDDWDGTYEMMHK
jgi:ligand-binding sensor domain-containing protein/class 3 adenylate cyclase